MYTPAIFLVFIVAAASATSKPPFQRVNNTVKSSPSDKVTVKSARSDFHHHGYDSTHHFPHHFNHHLGYGHHKEFEHYLLPLLMVLGMGVLFMPLLSLLMTSMVGNVPVTTLVSGRRKRETIGKPVEDQTIQKLWQKLGKAIEVFTKDNK